VQITTIKIDTRTKEQLDKYREYKNESYDEVVRKLLYIANLSRNEPKLSKKTIEQIEAARERIRKGEFFTEEQVRRRLGL
jgi:hypothetical protein